MKGTMLLALALGLGGCAAEVKLNQDADGDGLLDPDEVIAGSDPSVADSDGDGVDDGAEVSANTNPLDPKDRPFQNGWPIDACRNEVEGPYGDKKGDIAADFALLDQFNETVRLHDFCNQVVYLVFAAFW